MISQDKEKRLEYEAREKAIRDHNQLMYEARMEGENRVNKLHLLLLQNKRYDDLERSVKDSDFQKRLMKEYGITDD